MIKDTREQRKWNWETQKRRDYNSKKKEKYKKKH